eukprot:365393-Amphidinium_carterae.1
MLMYVTFFGGAETTMCTQGVQAKGHDQRQHRCSERSKGRWHCIKSSDIYAFPMSFPCTRPSTSEHMQRTGSKL